MKSSKKKSDLVCIYVEDPPIASDQNGNTTTAGAEGIPTVQRYARYHLQTTLQLMGCKPSHASDITENIFDWLSQARHYKYKQKEEEELQKVKQQEKQERLRRKQLQEQQQQQHLHDLQQQLQTQTEQQSPPPQTPPSFADKASKIDYQPDVKQFKLMRRRAASLLSLSRGYGDIEKEIEKAQSRMMTFSKTVPTIHERSLDAVLDSEFGSISQLASPKPQRSAAFMATSPKSGQNRVEEEKEEEKPKKRGMSRSKSLDASEFHKLESNAQMGEVKILLKQKNHEQLKQAGIGKQRHRKDIIVLSRSEFLEVVRAALASYEYSKPDQIEDFRLACEIGNRSRPLVILFGGTSGCGKSTLASLVASRLGISTVLSTDSVRHMLRNFISKEEQPVLFASTYHAGECLKQTHPHLSHKERVLKGYEMQSKLVVENLEKLIESCERKNEPLVVEGVHLLTDYVVDLMKRHPSVIPFVIYISNKNKHKERFAIRAKYMTLEPKNNKYVKYFENIRVIQDYLCKRATQFHIAKIDNTNVDRSVAATHLAIFESVKKLIAGETLFDTEKNVCTMPTMRKDPQPWSSKRMLKKIRSKKDQSGGKEDTLDDDEEANNNEAEGHYVFSEYKPDKPDKPIKPRARSTNTALPPSPNKPKIKSPVEPTPVQLPEAFNAMTSPRKVLSTMATTTTTTSAAAASSSSSATPSPTTTTTTTTRGPATAVATSSAPSAAGSGTTGENTGSTSAQLALPPRERKRSLVKHEDLDDDEPIRPVDITTKTVVDKDEDLDDDSSSSDEEEASASTSTSSTSTDKKKKTPIPFHYDESVLYMSERVPPAVRARRAEFLRKQKEWEEQGGTVGASDSYEYTDEDACGSLNEAD